MCKEPSTASATPMQDLPHSTILDYRWLPSPCKNVGTTRIFAISVNNSRNHVRSVLESFFSIESGNQSESREEFPMKATGVCEPDARIREVSFSLFSTEM